MDIMERTVPTPLMPLLMLLPLLLAAPLPPSRRDVSGDDVVDALEVVEEPRRERCSRMGRIP